MHRGARGTLCSRLAFVCSTGRVHVFASKSISVHFVFMTSLVREAVRIKNSKANWPRDTPVRA